MKQLPVYILAGGKSSRFGSDKARALLDEQPLVVRVQQMLMPFASRVTAVADRADKYADLGLRTIADLHVGLGPVAGLETALADLSPDEPWLLLCSCDAIILRRSWIDRLLDAAGQADHAAIAFRADRWQPMPALYARSALPAVREQLKADQRSFQQLLGRLDTAAIPLPPDWPDQWQANTRAQLDAHQPDPARDDSPDTDR